MRLCILLLLVTGIASGQEPIVAKPSRIRLAGISIGAGVGYSRGGFYPGWGGSRSPFYDPFWYMGYSDFYYPGYAGGFRRGPNMGEVKLTNVPRDAQIFLDGGFAGDAHHLKQIWLQPGKYALEVRDHGSTYHQTIYVLSGKTLRIEPVFQPAGGPQS